MALGARFTHHRSGNRVAKQVRKFAWLRRSAVSPMVYLLSPKDSFGTDNHPLNENRGRTNVAESLPRIARYTAV